MVLPRFLYIWFAAVTLTALVAYKVPADAQYVLAAGLDGLTLFKRNTKELMDEQNLKSPLFGHKAFAGENLADLGGLETAYAAYRRYVARHGEPPVIDGYTGDQRFFIAYAQAWQGKRREGALRQQLLSNPHSPDQYRVDGIVRNFDPWYKAFDVQPGDKLYLPPEERVHVW